MQLASYDVGNGYDEMFQPTGGPRQGAETLFERLEALWSGELRQYQNAAMVTMRNLGITFNVYGHEDGTEKVWPLDIIPRIGWSGGWRSACGPSTASSTTSPDGSEAGAGLDPHFPRAVLHCVDTAARSVHMITGSSDEQRITNEAEKRMGRLRSELQYTSIEDIFDEGLHEFIDRIQTRLNDV